MFSKRILASIFVPSAAVVTEAKITDKEEDDNFKCRPSELPIYTAETQQSILVQDQTVDHTPNFIEKSIGNIRMKVTSVVNQAFYYKTLTEDYVVDGISNAQGLIDYLGQDTADTTHKAGAIAVGGLTGLILGLRGGIIRRTLFTSIGALGMASICYPKEAAEYTNVAVEETKSYATIGYNFIYGVKADDPPLELPKLPTNLTEVWDLITSSTKQQSVSEQEKKADEQVIIESANDSTNTTDPTIKDDDETNLPPQCVPTKNLLTLENPPKCEARHEICDRSSES